MIWEKLFDWLERHLPSILLAFGLGYREGQEKKDEAEKKLLQVELEKRLAENALEVEKKNSGKSDSDVIREIFKRDGT